MTRTLVVTNDFPPRVGGIQTFVGETVRRMDPADVVVYTSRWDGAPGFDSVEPYRVVRYGHRTMLPTAAVAARAVSLVQELGAEAVLFGAAAPLGLLGPRLRRAGVRRLVALTHGHEAGWAGMPGGSPLLHRIGDGVDVVTYLGDYTRRRIAAALSAEAAARMRRLAPGVDHLRFRPDVDAAPVLARHGLAGRRVVVCVSRLMPRKGQDVLVEAWPAIRSRVPDAALLLVGGGPYRRRLERLVDATGQRDHVVLTGPVPRDQLPAYYAAGEVFAMPCRTRNRGLDVEGLGIVYLEASASGRPVVAGRSGGAPDAVLEGETGLVLDGTDRAEVADAVSRLLLDADLAAAMGAAGRAWVERSWRWERVSQRLAGLLAGDGDGLDGDELDDAGNDAYCGGEGDDGATVSEPARPSRRPGSTR
jgi:phosphatidylinositol alpha-1,6-mannosyltransferase